MKKILLSLLIIGIFAFVSSARIASAEIISVPDGSELGIPNDIEMNNYSANEVEEFIDKVWTYYSNNYYTDQWNWVEATYYLGVLEAYKTTGNMKYYDQAYQYAEGFSWECNSGVNTTYLDDIASSLVYCVLYDLAPNDYKLSGVKKALDYTYDYGLLDYSWVDEIFMVGLAQTYLSQELNDPKYSEIDLASYLFYREEFLDIDEMLWYRDGKYVYESDNPLGQSTNGKKVFWGRGNAWIYVTLAQRMEYMDKTDPAYEVYKNDFIMLSEGLSRCVREDGVWNPNLGDPNDYAGKEMTGTGGFLYGMSLGVRLGLLDKDKYIPIIQKAYDTITKECITEEGLLGYCQPVGWQPDGYSGEEAMKTSTNAFGVGLMLMGLSQYMSLCSDYEKPTLSTPNLEFDSSKAIYTIDDGWYKGIMTVSTSGATKFETGNGPENIVNGVYTRDNTGSRLSAFGLKKGPIAVEINLHNELTISKIIVDAYKNRAYKYTIEVLSGEEWVKVVDTTTKAMGEKFLNKWDFAEITCSKIRLTFAGCWNEDTDALSIREVFIYEKDAAKPIIPDDVIPDIPEQPMPEVPEEPGVNIEHKVTVLESLNGSITANKATVSTGELVTFELTPDEGYEIESIEVNDKVISLKNNKYTIFDVKEDLTVKANFKKLDIIINYYDETGSKLLYQKSSQTSPCEVIYPNSIQSTRLDDKYYYVFEGWYTDIHGGSKIEEFIFEESINLYARFTTAEYMISFESSIEMNVFETKQINVDTNLPSNFDIKYISSNKDILLVSSSGIITAIADGRAEIIINIGGIEYKCAVNVKADEANAKAKYVYGAGYVKYVGNTGIIYSSQATIVDENDQNIEFKYVDFSLDMYIESAATGNFGLVANKTVNSSGLAVDFLQFNFEIGKTNNVKLIRNGVTVNGTTLTYNFEIGKSYNFRVKTSPTENGKVIVVCYIDEVEVINVVVDAVEGSMCGIRMADMVTNRFANIKITNNIPTYETKIGEYENGTITLDKTNILYGDDLIVTIAPNADYYLSSLFINDEDVTVKVENGQYIIKNITNNINILPIFKKYNQVQVLNSQNGVVRPNITLVKDGESVVLTIIPAEGYRLDTLTINNELVTVSENGKYTIINVSSDVVVSATFIEKPFDKIDVEFYVENELIDRQTIVEGQAVIPPTVSKVDDGMIIYTFDYWRDAENNIYTEFVFAYDTKLFAHFTQSYHTLTLNYSNYEVNALESFTLTPTTSANFDFEYSWSSENESIVIVDKNGNVFAVGIGTTNICVSIDDVITKCNVVVKAADGYQFKGVYGATSNSTWKNGVYTFGTNGIQADLVDLNGIAVELDYFEIELNLILGCSVGTGSNFGFQINKTEKADGSVDQCYMLKPMTSANTQFVKNTTTISSVNNKTIKLEANKLYKIKIVVEKIETGRNIKAYVDGELYYDYTDTSPLNGTIFGIRCKALSDNSAPHKISIVSCKKY